MVKINLWVFLWFISKLISVISDLKDREGRAFACEVKSVKGHKQTEPMRETGASIILWPSMDLQNNSVSGKPVRFFPSPGVGEGDYGPTATPQLENVCPGFRNLKFELLRPSETVVDQWQHKCSVIAAGALCSVSKHKKDMATAS